MTPQQRLEKVREIFLAVKESSPDKRAEILHSRCGNDPELRAEVEAIIDAGEKTNPLAHPNEEGINPTTGQPATSVPGYRIHRTLGDGGQGIVYLATQLATGRRVALKVLKALAHGSPKVLARFEREIKVLAALDHPNVVSIVDRGFLTDGSPFLAMDFINGVSLATWITDRVTKSKDPSASAQAIPLFITICDAVNAAHLQGVTHRDLKPANILIDERDVPHIVDFGLAHTLILSGDGTGMDPITMTGHFMGSLPWASPEQANGQMQKIDTRSDVYSLGVILYQLVTGGKFPYVVAGTMREVLDNILTAQPPPPSSVIAKQNVRERRQRRAHRSTGINRELDAIVLKALAKRRDDRYQNAGELKRDLENYLAGRPSGALVKLQSARRLDWIRRFATISGIALLVGFVGFFSLRSFRHATSKPASPAIVAKQAVRATILPEPVIHWDFDDPAKLTRAKSGNQIIDSRAKGIQAVEGRFNGAIHLKAGAYIKAGDRPQFHIKSSMAVSAWIRLPTKPSGSSNILSKTYAPDSYSFYITDSSVGFSIFLPLTGTPSQQEFNVMSSIESGKWVHVLGCYDGHQLRLYVNGNLVDFVQVVEPSGTPGEIQDSDMYLRAGDGSAEFDLDELNLYSCVMNVSQIARLADNPIPSSEPRLFDDLSDEEKLAVLAERVNSNAAFDFGSYNALRAIFGVLNRPDRAMQQCDIIFKNQPMEEYTLHILADWNEDNAVPSSKPFNPHAAIGALLQNATQYPELIFVSAACWTRACDLQSDIGKARELAEKVTKVEGHQFDVYHRRVAARIKFLTSSAPSTKNSPTP